MIETPPNSVAIAEPNSHEETLGLIGAMMDGIVSQFEHRGLIVRRSGESIEVANQDEEPLGGYLLIESATVIGVKEWIDAKADYYGEDE